MRHLWNLATSERAGVLFDVAGNLVMAGAIWGWFYTNAKAYLGAWKSHATAAVALRNRWAALSATWKKTPALPGAEPSASSPLRKRTRLRIKIYAGLRSVTLFLLHVIGLVLNAALVVLETIFVGKLSAPLFFIGLALWLWAEYVAFLNATW